MAHRVVYNNNIIFVVQFKQENANEKCVPNKNREERKYYNQNISHKRYGAIKSIAHNAKKFGVIYKCSVRRK
jgi:hypothetical protein